MADPAKYDDIFEKAGKDNNVDPDLLRAIAKQESGFRPKAVGPVTSNGQRAHGMMQLMPDTAQALGVSDPFDPAQAIPGAAKLIAQHLDQYGNVDDAVSAYHGGTDQAQWGAKTKAYREAVTANYGGGQATSADDLTALASGGAVAAPKAPGAPSPTKTDTGPDLEALASGAAPDQKPSDVEAIYEGGAEAVTPQQKATLNILRRGHVYDPDADDGTEKKPLALKGDATEEDVIAQYPDGGTFYVTQDGQLKRTPIKGESISDRVSGGLSQGVMDVPQSVLGLFPHAKDTDSKSAYTDLKASQMVYDAAHKGDLVASAPRLVGQIVGSAPVMAGAESAAGAIGLTRLLGPAGTFLAGKAGAEAIPAGASVATKAAQVGTRVASKMAQGAGQGAEAATLTSSTSDAPLDKQIEGGALAGGALAPVGGALVNVGKKLVASKLIGAAPMAEQQAAAAAAGNLPVPVKLTTGQLTGAPGQQMAENAMMRGGKGAGAARIMGGAASDADTALKANIPAIQSQMAGRALEPNEGGIIASNKLNEGLDAAKARTKAAYTQAEASADGAFLPHEERPVINQRLRESVKDYDPETIAPVTRVLDGLDVHRTNQLTPTDLFAARSKLTNLRASNDGVTAGAAGKATKELDAYMNDAVANDLISGDPKVVQAWKTAIKARREQGQMFEGNDFIQALTERTRHGDGVTLKVAPEDAANMIFGANDIGFTTKKNFTRDMTRLKTVLGPDSPEWGALRAEAFGRLARAAGPSDKPFSGAGFQTAWSKAKDRAPQALDVLFTPEERQMIDDFAETARRATVPVKGGDNPSNSGVYLAAAKKFMGSLGGITGAGTGAAIGSVVGGPGGAAAGATMGKGAGNALDSFFSDLASARAARKAVNGKPAVLKALDPKLKLLGNVTGKAPLVVGARLLGNPQSVAPQPVQ